MLAGLSAMMGGFGLGLSGAWTSPALLRIDESDCLPDDCDVSGVSETEASWIATIATITPIFSGPIAGGYGSYSWGVHA